MKSAAVERWFASTKPPSEAALRRVRELILGADPSMRERIQYGITFSSTKSGDFAAFVRYSESGVNLRLMRGRRLHGRYSHLEGTTVKRMRIADEREASARAGGAEGDGQGMVRARRRRNCEGDEAGGCSDARRVSAGHLLASSSPQAIALAAPPIALGGAHRLQHV